MGRKDSSLYGSEIGLEKRTIRVCFQYLGIYNFLFQMPYYIFNNILTAESGKFLIIMYVI